MDGVSSACLSPYIQSGSGKRLVELHLSIHEEGPSGQTDFIDRLTSSSVNKAAINPAIHQSSSHPVI